MIQNEFHRPGISGNEEFSPGKSSVSVLGLYQSDSQNARRKLENSGMIPVPAISG
jgi:hypothetical protein